MAISPVLIRRRVVQGVAVVLLLAALPEAAQRWVPSVARYVPPFLLSSLVLISILYALTVWRTRWVLALLLPGQELGSREQLSPERRRNEAIAASVSVGVAVTLLAMWVASLL